MSLLVLLVLLLVEDGIEFLLLGLGSLRRRKEREESATRRDLAILSSKRLRRDSL